MTQFEIRAAWSGLWDATLLWFAFGRIDLRTISVHRPSAEETPAAIAGVSLLTLSCRRRKLYNTR
jgi:hypothetical protein